MLNGSKVTLWQAVVVLRCEGYSFGTCHRGNDYEATLYRMFHLFHSHYKSPNDFAVPVPSPAVRSGPNPLTVCAGLAAECVSHCHESDLLGPSREGGKTPEDLVFGVPAGVTHQAAGATRTGSSNCPRQLVTASSILVSYHRAENSLMKD